MSIESDWRETGIVCPFCDGEYMTYSDGESRPQCSNLLCQAEMPDSYIWQWLITLPISHKDLHKYAASRFAILKASGQITNHDVV